MTEISRQGKVTDHFACKIVSQPRNMHINHYNKLFTCLSKTNYYMTVIRSTFYALKPS